MGYHIIHDAQHVWFSQSTAMKVDFLTSASLAAKGIVVCTNAHCVAMPTFDLALYCFEFWNCFIEIGEI